MSGDFSILFEYNTFIARIQDPDQIVNVFEEWYDGTRAESARMTAIYDIDNGATLEQVRLLLAGKELNLEE